MGGIRLNKKQERLYKALEQLTNGLMLMEDAVGVTKELSNKEVLEVTDKFSKVITDFNIEELRKESRSYEWVADSILTDIETKFEEINQGKDDIQYWVDEREEKVFDSKTAERIPYLRSCNLKCTIAIQTLADLEGGKKE